MKVEKNISQGGIEVYFDKKPSEEVIDLLRREGWRWHRTKKCWYSIRTERSEQLADALLCSYLKTHIILLGADYDSDDFKHSLYQMSQAVNRIKARSILVRQLSQYENFVSNIEAKVKITITQREAHRKALIKRNDEMIVQSHQAFVRKAQKDYTMGEDKFWSSYDDLICFDRQGSAGDYRLSEFATLTACTFYIKNPDPSITSIREHSYFLNHERIEIKIVFKSVDETGSIRFGADEYHIPEKITKKIIEKHMPLETKKAVDKQRREFLLEKARSEARRRDAEHDLLYTGLRCLYCGAHISIGQVCAQCNNLYMKKRR